LELSFDTSTDIAGIALSSEGVVQTEVTWAAGMNHTTQLLPTVGAMLELTGAEMSEISAVFVALGPGSFAGIRVALSTAKGMAFSLKIPLVGISTLEFEAYPFAHTRLPISALHEAGRSELAVATYQEVAGRWRCLEPHHLTTVNDLCAATVSLTVFCGEITPAFAEDLGRRLGDLATIPRAVARLRRTGNLAALGWQKLQESGPDDPALLQPIYMRRPHITIPKPRD